MGSKISHASAYAWELIAQYLLINQRLILINSFSFFAIAYFSGTFLTSVFLLAYVIGNFWVSLALAKARSPKLRQQIYGASVLLSSTVFLLLQHKGLIGVLDSKNASAPSTLPFLMGYAFYFLQTLAIHGAIYRRVITGLDFQRYLLAVSFCGAFLAGPIFNQEQLRKIQELEITWPASARIYQYLPLFAGALLFKYVFANWLSHWVLTKEASSPLLIARSVLCFELEVYFDFAGYSLLSYCLCRLFSIPMYHNFQHPFGARNIPEFWRRWHVGLGTFFKENFFLPFKSLTSRPFITRLILPSGVFLLSAMWHGPTRNFLLWGLFHGAAFATSVALLKRWPKSWLVAVGNRLTVFVVLFYGRLLFMESDYALLLQKFRRLGMFRDMARELLTSVKGVAWPEFLLNQWDSTLIAAGIVGVLAYEIFALKANYQPCYRYLRPGFWAFLVFVMVLLFFQPIELAGFVYGR